MFFPRQLFPRLGLAFSLLVVLGAQSGCGDPSTQAPTAEEAAQTPPLAAPTTKSDSSTFSPQGKLNP
jgi:hypothetical protein